MMGNIPGRENIHRWLLEGKAKGASHMLVICDEFEWSDYPFYLYPDMNVQEEVRLKRQCTEQNMQRVVEVYDLSLDLDAQLDEVRAWHV